MRLVEDILHFYGRALQLYFEFPNLSLVDLPGLRAVDDEQEAGLKEQIEEMVTDTIASENAVVLAVCAQNPCLAPLSY